MTRAVLVFPLLVVAALIVTLPVGGACGEPEQGSLKGEMQGLFDAWLEDPGSYEARALKECRKFPEGDLFPFVLPAMAYAQRAFGGEIAVGHARKQVSLLVGMAVRGVARRFKTTPSKLASSPNSRQQATYLCQLNLALGAQALLGDSSRMGLHDSLTDRISGELEDSGGRPLHSFPGLLWPFDTVPCLVSVAMHARARGNLEGIPLLAKHLSWLKEHATDRATGLPMSRLDAKTYEPLESPRGCELSWRIALLALVDRKAAQQMYARYKKHFWLERLVVAGFAEWPHGDAGKEDVDSGPIWLGIGSAASVLGGAAGLAMGDDSVVKRLLGQVESGTRMLGELLANSNSGTIVRGGIKLRRGYKTGFLFGDAVFFYALTWNQWKQVGEHANK